MYLGKNELYRFQKNAIFSKIKSLLSFPVSSDGGLKYDEVRTFITKQHGITTYYKSITTSLNYSISLSEKHLIYSRKSGSGKFHTM